MLVLADGFQFLLHRLGPRGDVLTQMCPPPQGFELGGQGRNLFFGIGGPNRVLPNGLCALPLVEPRPVRCQFRDLSIQPLLVGDELF